MTQKQVNQYIFSKLKNTQGGNTYPMIGEGKPPFKVYQMITNTGIPVLEGSNLYNNYLYQIDLWDYNYQNLLDTLDEVLLALSSNPAQGVNVSLLGTQELKEDDLYRVIIQIKVWDLT